MHEILTINRKWEQIPIATADVRISFPVYPIGGLLCKILVGVRCEMSEIRGEGRQLNSCNVSVKKLVLTLIMLVFSSKTNYHCEMLTNSTEVFNSITY